MLKIIILTVEITLETMYKRYLYPNIDCGGSIHELLKLYS